MHFVQNTLYKGGVINVVCGKQKRRLIIIVTGVETNNIFIEKKSDVKSIDRRESIRDRTFGLCDCEFQIKVVKPKISRYSNNLLHATIYIHSKHSGHNPMRIFLLHRFIFT